VGLAQAEQVGLEKNIIVGKDFHTQVGTNHALDVKGDCQTSAGKRFLVEAGQSLEIVCGQSSFHMDQDGTVTIKGTKFQFEASDSVKINGQTVDVNPE
jgi:type VI secretion system secreted protein VgrG